MMMLVIWTRRRRRVADPAIQGVWRERGKHRDGTSGTFPNTWTHPPPHHICRLNVGAHIFLRLVRRAVVAQIRLADAQLAQARWSKAKKSYGNLHLGRAAQNIINATSDAQSQKVQRHQEHLSKILEQLHDLPQSMYEYVKDFRPEQEHKRAEEYLNDVKGWVDGLRPLVELAEQKQRDAEARRFVTCFDSLIRRA